MRSRSIFSVMIALALTGLSSFSTTARNATYRYADYYEGCYCYFGYAGGGKGMRSCHRLRHRGGNMQGLLHGKERQGLAQVQKSMLFVGYGVDRYRIAAYGKCRREPGCNLTPRSLNFLCSWNSSALQWRIRLADLRLLSGELGVEPFFPPSSSAFQRSERVPSCLARRGLDCNSA